MDVHVGNPVVRGALTVFPVFNGAAVADTGYALGGVVVAERRDAAVGELLVTNPGDRPALVLEGELLAGGRQDRVAARSVLVEPGSAAVLPVRCVEQARWAGAGVHARDGRRAPLAVRTASGQREVWERVARYGHGESLFDTVRHLDAAASALVAGLSPLPFQSGVLVGIAGRPVLLEVFDAPSTLAAVWGGLLHAAALDALGRRPVATLGRHARRFVRDLGPRVSVLRWQGRDVHAVAINERAAA
ncbi:ARPP-1 family domain-containing protein [Pseudonocardia broussonetiae]|uniref:ARG and Rhodanese-Phosphatase-superfamily-associated domain-containing protein n=1 Tax=Pseudonocardia broussonetiae TaxID=2736640 RepID=A0A6M6JUM0_9PSEU|nr:DUF6569 family protein [Pseudonocardia broussonetiae]QJY49831.1 hypothetical protein HOP40_32060 [Pseudonocardia broussonetiae]